MTRYCKKSGKHKNGVKDLGVYSFYASYPGVLFPQTAYKGRPPNQSSADGA